MERTTPGSDGRRDAPIHRLTLRFTDDLERPFLRDYFRKSVWQVRIAQLVGASLYGIFALIDPWVIPEVTIHVWALRAAVITFFLITFALTYTPLFERWMQPAITGMALIAGFGMIWVMIVAPFPARELYHPGLTLVILAAYTFMKLRFAPAVVAALVLGVGYNVADVFIRDTPLPVLLSNNFYLLGANVVGMFAGYNMELYTRRDFLQRRRLEDEEAQVERLLLNVLPPSIAERLKYTPGSIADRFGSVTILFTDIVHFTELSSRVSAEELVALLNDVFSAFDELVEKHGLEKIKTIGDAYMAVAGVPTLRKDHAEAVADFALDMLEAMAGLNASRPEPLRLRVGMHTGPVVAGVIGTKKFAYDLWGDTVNTASRMESHGLPDAIQVTRATYERLRDNFELRRRGPIDVKGKGEMVTYMLIGRKNGGAGTAASA
jgi:class 3 adenylate cyclase